VEYEAILLSLCKLRAINIQTWVLCTDSKVVLRQIEKECIVREPTLERYLALVRRMESYFEGFMVESIERNKNTEADDLAKATARNTLMLVDVFFSSTWGCFSQNSPTKAQSYPYHRRGSLDSSNNNIPSPLLWVIQQKWANQNAATW
jgi:ribonuclease HI